MAHEEQRGVHEVSARALVASHDMAARSGVPLNGIFAELPFDEASARRRRRVDWASYCVFIERLEERAGGAEALARILTNEYHRVLPEVRWLAGALVSPKALARAVFELVAPMAFPPATFRYRDAGPERAVVEVHLLVGARPCLTWFRGNVATMAGLSLHLDLPPVQVDARFGDTWGVYDCVMPRSRTLAATTERAVRTMVYRLVGQMVLSNPPAAAGSPIVAGPPVGEGSDIAARLVTATHTWGLTARQIEVLELLARGEANKEIAQALDCAENTVELHVTQLLRKSASPTRAKLMAKFWSEL